MTEESLKSSLTDFEHRLRNDGHRLPRLPVAIIQAGKFRPGVETSG
jgi:hypothetical protein